MRSSFFLETDDFTSSLKKTLLVISLPSVFNFVFPTPHLPSIFTSNHHHWAKFSVSYQQNESVVKSECQSIRISWSFVTLQTFSSLPLNLSCLSQNLFFCKILSNFLYQLERATEGLMSHWLICFMLSCLLLWYFFESFFYYVVVLVERGWFFELK